MSSQVFVVFGATGAQGGSVIRAIEHFNKTHSPAQGFKVRGFARHTDSDGAKKLIKEFPDVELVAGDMNKPEDLDKVLTGATHLFAVTQFWDPASMGREKEIGELIAKAAKKAGIKYVWWSSLPNADHISKGKLHVPHFSDKKIVEEKMKEMGLKVIAVGPAFYYTNWTKLFSPKTASDGTLEWTLPLQANTTLSAFAVDDIGHVVAATLTNPDTYVGSFIPCCGEHTTVQKYIDTIGEVCGRKTRLVTVPYKDWAKSAGFQGADEAAEMCEWFNQFGYFGPGAAVDMGRKLAPNMQSFKTWLQNNQPSLPA